tara:strand:- start:233 stop:382 length:150 start_codon:yes stop_codon:yes gene_type:complete
MFWSALSGLGTFLPLVKELIQLIKQGRVPEDELKAFVIMHRLKEFDDRQ